MDGRAVAPVVGVLLLAVPSFGAEGEPVLVPGARVRVTAPRLAPEPLVGAVEALPGETLVLESRKRGPAVRIPLDEITRLEISRGRPRRKGALLGAAIGGAVGLAITLSCSSESDCDTAAVGALYGLGGLALGAAVGAAATRERWEDLPPKRIRVSLVPTCRGLAIRASLALR